MTSTNTKSNSDSNKAILLVCDGLGDRPSVNGMTPLQAANTPHLDALCTSGISGLLDVISPGIVPGSDTAHLALFGYDPYKQYPGRGVFEALGADMALHAGDVAFRANFATVDAEMRVLDRRAGRKGSKELAALLDGLVIEDVKIALKNTTQHRCAVVMKGEGLSRYVSDVDSHVAGTFVQDCKPLRDGAAERKTARIVNTFVKLSYELLNEHPINAERRQKGELPANIIIMRGAGTPEPITSLRERFGFSAACVAGASLYKGVAQYVGMDVLQVEGATGKADTNLKNKAEAALHALEVHDFVFLHVKDTDNHGHDGDFEGKKAIIERVDAELVALLKDADAYLAVTGDHSTPVALKRHCSDPVPILIHGNGVRADNVTKFDEFSVASGGLCRIHGLDVMPILADYMGYYVMYGT